MTSAGGFQNYKCKKEENLTLAMITVEIPALAVYGGRGRKRKKGAKKSKDSADVLSVGHL